MCASGADIALRFGREQGFYAEATLISEQNVEIVRRFYDAWSRDEFPGPLELMDPEIEYVNPAGAIEPGARSGMGAFAEAIEKLLESWEFWRAETEDFRIAGDRVAVVVRYRARGRGSGVEVEGRESALWTLREGRVVRYVWFHGPTEAFDALGLSQDARTSP